TVHASHDTAGELAFDLGLELFGAHTLVTHLGLAALGATFGRRRLVAAVVTHGDVAFLVKRERQVAEAALLDVAACRAVNIGGEAPAIEQQDYLPAGFQRLNHGSFEAGAKAVQAAVGMAVMPHDDE